MKKFLLIILLVIFFAILAGIAYCKLFNKPLPPFSKQVTNGVTVLHLSGNYEQMGTEFGILESQELNTYYQKLMANTQIIDMSNNKNMRATIYMYSRLPSDFRNYLRGVAAGSDLSLLKILRISASLPLSYVSSCSVLLTDGTVNANQHNIIVRNLDARQNIMNLIAPDSRAIVSILNNQTVVIGSLINLPAATIINKNRILLEANNGMLSESKPYYRNQFNVTLMDQAALQFSDVDKVENYLSHNLPSTAYLTGIISPSQIAYFEIAPTVAKEGCADINKHIIAYTNFFIDPVLAQQPRYDLNNDSKTQAVRRYLNLTALAKKDIATKHKFSSDDLKSIITTPINDGGPFAEPGKIAKNNPDVTVYSIYYDANLNQLSIYPQSTHRWVNVGV